MPWLKASLRTASRSSPVRAGASAQVSPSRSRRGRGRGVHVSLARRQGARSGRGIEAAGRAALPIKADASSEEDTRRAVEQTVARFGRINILVNNAGAIGEEVAIRDMSIAEWDKLIGTDLRGVFLTTHFALPHIPFEPVGKIINIGSELALKGRANYGHYCAAKGGIVGFTYASRTRSRRGSVPTCWRPGRSRRI